MRTVPVSLTLLPWVTQIAASQRNERGFVTDKTYNFSLRKEWNE